MHFKQYGKTFQLRIETAADLKAVLTLDESHWVATSAPTEVFRCDPHFVSLLDPDGSGRIHTNEMKQAIGWFLSVLSDRSKLKERTNHVPLAAINADSSDGQEVLTSAKYVLKALGREGDDHISLKRVRRFLSNLKAQPLNGDGVLVPGAASDPETTQLIRDIIATVGGETDASGEMGITSATLKQFKEAVGACLAWRAAGEALDAAGNVTVKPYGEQTPQMHATFSKHADLVDHFFALCRAVRFDPRTVEHVRCPQSVLESFDFSKPGDMDACLTRSPLAAPRNDDLLPLAAAELNPLYAQWVSQLKQDVLIPVLGEVGEALDVEEWARVKQALKPYADYIATQKGALVQTLSHDQLQQYLDASAYDAVQKLVEADKAVSDMLKGIHEVERLVLYHQHLMRLANNFVSFSELYHPPIRAMFEEGTALLDGRWFDLALRVKDINQHSAIAKSSNIFTFYLEVSQKAADQKFVVAVPATSGSKGNLGVGKRGVFFDWKGREYDAIVVKVIDNPISLSEALVAPFTRLWSFVLGKIEAMSGSLEKQLQKSTDSLMKAPPPSAPAAAPAGGMAGGPAAMLIGLSVSAAAIGSAFAFITKTFSGLQSGQIVAGVFGAAAVVAVPVSLIAVLKLRRQDLSALLEGCGWAINARMRFDNVQRRSFTRRKPYPLGATGTPHRAWGKQVLIAVVVVGVVWGLRAGCQRRQDEAPVAETVPQEAVVPAATQ